MLRDLSAGLGRDGCAVVLGVSGMTVRTWLRGNRFSAASKRLVWFSWCLVFHPERLSSIGELVTWGRFRLTRGPPTRPEDWSGWSI
jgi:hypothetical protein